MEKENQKFIHEVFTLALPAGLQQVIDLAVNLIDNIMIGSLGEASISAVSISGTYTWLCSVFVMAMAAGASIISAQDYGNKNLDRIKKLMSFVITLAIIFSMIFFVITALFPSQILRIYTNVDSVIAPGVAYLKYLKYSIPLFGISTAITVMLRSVRSVKLGLYNSIFSCFSNVFFNWVFIFGHLGAPAMGVAGAAVGTLIARIIQLIVSVVYLFYIEKNLCFRISDFDPRIDLKLFKQFVSITLPLLIMDILANLATSAQTMITGRISDSYLSANSITHMAWQIPSVFCWGIGTAAGIMVGNSLGNDNFDQAKADSDRFLKATFFFGLFSAIMVQVLIPILMQFYNITEATKTLTHQMGYMASIAAFFIAYNSIICNGVIKSGGHTKKLLRIELLGTWLFAIPFGYIAAFVLHWPAYVLYLVLRAGNIIKSSWGIYYLKHGKWMQKIVD